MKTWIALFVLIFATLRTSSALANCSAVACGTSSCPSACTGQNCITVTDSCNNSIECLCNGDPTGQHQTSCGFDFTCCTSKTTQAQACAGIVCGGVVDPTCPGDGHAGFNCGSCPAGQACTSQNTCCQLATCAGLRMTCGTAPDACGGTLTCGPACSPPAPAVRAPHAVGIALGLLGIGVFLISKRRKA